MAVVTESYTQADFIGSTPVNTVNQEQLRQELEALSLATTPASLDPGGSLLFKTTGPGTFTITIHLEIGAAGSLDPADKALVDSAVADHTAAGAIDPTPGAEPPVDAITPAERDAIPAPVAGRLVYDKTNNKFDFFDGTAWKAFLFARADTLVIGSIPFATASHELNDDDDLAWDDSGKRLLVGGVPVVVGGPFLPTAGGTVSGRILILTAADIQFQGGSGNNFIRGNVDNTGRLGFFTENIERLSIALTGAVNALTGLQVAGVPVLVEGDAYTIAQVDALIDPVLKASEAFAPSGSYPTTFGGSGVQQGDTFRIVAAGSMGAITVNVEDLLIALVDTPGQTDASWHALESNRDQASETVKGVAEIATQVETDAGIDNTRFLTPLRLASRLTGTLNPGNLIHRVVELSATSTLGIPDRMAFVDAAAAVITTSLPANPFDGEWHEIQRVNAGSNNVIVDGNGKTIRGVATISLTTQWASLRFHFSSTAGEWRAY